MRQLVFFGKTAWLMCRHGMENQSNVPTIISGRCEKLRFKKILYYSLTYISFSPTLETDTTVENGTHKPKRKNNGAKMTEEGGR